MSVSAPGKLVLLGEYAVLEGAPVIVAAIDRRAVGVLSVPSARSPCVRSRVVDAVIARAEEGGSACGSGDGRAFDVEIDTDRFRDEAGRKLGLGSSAAVAVVAASLVTGRCDEVALEIAIDAHRAAFGGEGSGVDVAASFHGGVIATRRQPFEVEPLSSRVGDLSLSVLFTGESASTSEFVRACRASKRFDSWIAVLSRIANAGLRAYRAREADAFLRAVSEYGRAMAGLGRDAGVPIVTEQIEAIMRLVGENGGAAKPSGAGGGDVVVVWSRDADSIHEIAEATSSVVLDLAIDPAGLRRED